MIFNLNIVLLRYFILTFYTMNSLTKYKILKDEINYISKCLGNDNDLLLKLICINSCLNIFLENSEIRVSTLFQSDYTNAVFISLHG
jgi:hypothetical protein